MNDKSLQACKCMQWRPLCKSSSSFEMHALTPDHAEDVTVRLLHLAIDLRCMATRLTNRTVQTPAASMCHSSNDSNNRAGMLKCFQPARGLHQLGRFFANGFSQKRPNHPHIHFYALAMAALHRLTRAVQVSLSASPSRSVLSQSPIVTVATLLSRHPCPPR